MWCWCWNCGCQQRVWLIGKKRYGTHTIFTFLTFPLFSGFVSPKWDERETCARISSSSRRFSQISSQKDAVQISLCRRQRRCGRSCDSGSPEAVGFQLRRRPTRGGDVESEKDEGRRGKAATDDGRTAVETKPGEVRRQRYCSHIFIRLPTESTFSINSLYAGILV